MHGGDLVEAYSAGIRPSGRLDDKAIEAMCERGYDLGTHHCKGLADVPGEFDVVVTMGCEESCPNVPAKRRIAWELPHPKDVRPEDFGTIRDRIEDNVQSLLAGLSNT
jgi:arsenate reductase